MREFFSNLNLNNSLCSARVTHTVTNHTLEGVLNFLETIQSLGPVGQILLTLLVKRELGKAESFCSN